MHSSPASGIKNNRFLPPTPSSTGSMTALTALAGGRSGLFRAYSTLKNWLLLRQTNGRVRDKRKCSKEVSCRTTHNEERGLVEPTVFIEIQSTWVGGFEHGHWNQMQFQPQFCHLLAPWSGLPAGTAELRKDSLCLN